MELLYKAIIYIPQGILVTLQYSLISIFLGLIIGTILALCKVGNNSYLKLFAQFYTSIFRGTPLLVQLSFAYFALPSIIGYDISAFAAGIIAFSLNSGAYVSENIKAGIESVDKGQFEAAKSLGINYSLMMKFIILPQAVKNILPSLVNEAINLTKESAIISIIGEADIMRRANIFSAEHSVYAEPLLIAGLSYYLLVLILGQVAKVLENRFNKI